MKRHMTVLAAIAIFIVAAELAHAQAITEEPFRKEMVASGVLMQPQGDFQRALQTVAFGGGFHGLFAIGSSGASAGVDSQLMFFDRDGQTADMMGTIHGLVRFGQRLGPRRPYAEALGGIRNFSAENRIGTFSYGVGVGMQFPLARSMSAGAPEREVVEIGVRYLRGGRARVNDRRPPSNTHSVMVHVGWGLQF
jgi:hypothetical protein